MMGKLILTNVVFFCLTTYTVFPQSIAKKNNHSSNYTFNRVGQVNLGALPEDHWKIAFQMEDWDRNHFSEKYAQKLAAPIPTQKVTSKNERSKASNSAGIQVRNKFMGMANGESPPDNGTSISNGNHIIHAINSQLIIYDTLGNELTTAQSLNTFFNAPLGSYLSDPRVVYDAYADRFIVLASAIGDQLLLAFSQTNDPTKSWNMYNIQVEPVGSGVEFFDQPAAMVNENELLISGLVVSSNYQGEGIVQIRKKDGYTGKSLHTKIWDNFIDADGAPAQVLGAVNFAQQGAAYGTKAYFINTGPYTFNKVYLYEISDTLNGSPSLNCYGINTNAFDPPPNVSQKGSDNTLITTDSRTMSAFLLSGIIHFVYHFMDPSTGQCQIAYNRLDVVSKTLSTVFWGSDTSNYSFPSIASFGKNASDPSILLCYLESNANLFPSINAVVCDQNMNFETPLTVKAGNSFIDGVIRSGSCRWGDYTSCVRKQNASGPEVWISGEIGYFGYYYVNWIAQLNPSTSNAVYEQVSEENTLTIYPNPVISNFTLELKMDKTTPLQVVIYGVDGKFVKELFNGPAQEGENTLTFNKRALSNGLYFVRVMSEDHVLRTEKLIIE